MPLDHLPPVFPTPPPPPRLGKNFHFKNQIPKDLISGVVYKFQCGLCSESYYGECIRHLNVRIGEHIGISTLTRK